MKPAYCLSRLLLLSLVITFNLSIGAPNVMASIFGKSELSGSWKERFQDLTKLKAYTDQGLKVEVSDAIIEKYDLSGATFVNATFKDNEWNEMTGKNMVITNTVFRGVSFNVARFESSVLTNVTFEDSEFFRTSFYRSKLIGVKFIRCKFIESNSFQQINSSNISFAEATLDKVEFADAQANISFNHSTLTDVSLTDLAFPSTLTFENSKLEDIALDRSKITKLTMDNVTGGGRSGFAGGSIAEVEVRNSAMGFNLMEGNIGKVTFVNSVVNVNFASSNIKDIQITNCKKMRRFGLYQAKVDTLNISNCPINNFRPLEAIIQNFSIDHAPIVNSDFGDMKVKNFTLTDVTLDQKIDFTGAQVENLITKNVTKLPGLNLNLTGSNVKF